MQREQGRPQIRATRDSTCLGCRDHLEFTGLCAEHETRAAAHETAGARGGRGRCSHPISGEQEAFCGREYQGTLLSAIELEFD